MIHRRVVPTRAVNLLAPTKEVDELVWSCAGACSGCILGIRRESGGKVSLRILIELLRYIRGASVMFRAKHGRAPVTTPENLASTTYVSQSRCSTCSTLLFRTRSSHFTPLSVSIIVARTSNISLLCSSYQKTHVRRRRVTSSRIGMQCETLVHAVNCAIGATVQSPQGTRLRTQ